MQTLPIEALAQIKQGSGSAEHTAQATTAACYCIKLCAKTVIKPVHHGAHISSRLLMTFTLFLLALSWHVLQPVVSFGLLCSCNIPISRAYTAPGQYMEILFYTTQLAHAVCAQIVVSRLSNDMPLHTDPLWPSFPQPRISPANILCLWTAAPGDPQHSAAHR